MAINSTICSNTPIQLSASTDDDDMPSQLLPLSFLKSGQFLALPAHCRGGLIVEKRFYADLVAPGAAVGAFFDSNCTKVYPIGEIHFWSPSTQLERQQAFQKRIACNRRLQLISQNPSAISRARETLELLYGWIGNYETDAIPNELIARIAGVLPKTVEIVRKLQEQKQTTAMNALAMVQ